MARKIYPKSGTTDSAQQASRSAAIAALTAGFEQPGPARGTLIPRSIKGTMAEMSLYKPVGSLQT